MNCYGQCYNFIQTKNPAYLGDINQLGSCANCLYWQKGPGNPIFPLENCQCTSVINKVTANGTKMDQYAYNTGLQCLQQYSSIGSPCQSLYSTWSNRPVSDPEMALWEARQGDSMYRTCMRKRTSGQGLGFPGVL